MAQALGSLGQILIQEETTFKTTPTADAKLLYFTDESLTLKRNLHSSASIRGNRNPVKPSRGNVDVSGDISMQLQAFPGLVWKAVLGSVSTTGTGPYVHTFSIGSSVPSLVVEKGFTDINQYFLYNGCKINSCSLSFTTEGFQMVKFSVIGAKETTSSSSYDATPTNNGEQNFDGFAVSTIEEGGSSIGIVNALDITIENNIDGNSYVIKGSGERYSLPVGKVKVTGTIKALFEDLTLYNKAINSTETSIKIAFTNGTGDGSAGNEYIEFYIPELIYSPQAPEISGETGVLVTLPFEAYYDNSTEATAIQIVLKNTEPTI